MNAHEFMAKMLTAFPSATVQTDDDGQLLVHTNLYVYTSLTNPAIPLGEVLIMEKV